MKSYLGHEAIIVPHDFPQINLVIFAVGHIQLNH